MSRGMLSEARNLDLHHRRPHFDWRVIDATAAAVASSLAFHDAYPVAPGAARRDKEITRVSRSDPGRAPFFPSVTAGRKIASPSAPPSVLGC